MTTPTARRKRSSRCASWSRATKCCSTFQLLGTPLERRGAEVSQHEEGAAAVRRHRRVEVHRPEELPLDDGLQPQLFRRGPHLRPVHHQGASECQGRHALSERRPRQGLSERHQGRPRRQGGEDDRGGSLLRSLRSDHRFADPQDQGRRRGPVLQRHDAEAGGAGDQEDPRTRLEAGAHPRHQRHLGRRRHEAGRARSFQGRDQRQLRQGSARSDLEGRRRHEEVFRVHGEVLSRTATRIRASTPTATRPRS